MEPQSKLLRPTADEVRHLNSTCKCSVSADDFDDWERVLLDPKNDPIPHMQVERQRRNDCQGNSIANIMERMIWGCTSKMPQLSEIFAYNASEYLMGPRNVGRDSGSSIHSGVRLVVEGIPSLGVKPGIPLESDWPYHQYCQSAGQFESLARKVPIQQSLVAEHAQLPKNFQSLLAGLAANGGGHIGTYWSPQWNTERIDGKLVSDKNAAGSGGHATAIIWARKVRGQWMLIVWNSHGDAFYWMTQRRYEWLAERDFSPFGGFLLMPDRAQERYYNRLESGGGYI